jgi:hypothetical protein
LSFKQKEESHMSTIIEMHPKVSPSATNEPPCDGEALRAELRSASEIRKGADARAKLACEAEHRGAIALRTAQTEIDKLETVQEQASLTAIGKAAKAAAAALRAGSPVPAATPLPQSANTASLATARAQKSALEVAHFPSYPPKLTPRRLRPMPLPLKSARSLTPSFMQRRIRLPLK